jgi:hypothetical protein
MGAGGQRQASAALPTWKRPGSNCTRGFVGPTASLDRWAKSHTPLGFDPQTVQPMVSRYNNWAIPAHYTYILHLRNAGK